ncbi:hypothetical protein CC78DRAFT_529192 [Lojkania enalia]|uniref:CCHC-type domain-containing protein n=1 Tax=Lojkania enalia TaxID=147567 RepID=A0A9P4NA26_9PLEO|nr:hypothetical protein CC78DRAFT_529192 [Didymosphaeria enalia]
MASSTPKTMSSRLMTMKFMQRSAAKSTPSSSPNTPSGPPSSKRQRLSNGASVPGTPSEHEAMQMAIREEEQRREEALRNARGQMGEERWVLSFRDPVLEDAQRERRVVSAGFAELDGEGDGEQMGRLRFGGGVKRAPAKEESSEDTTEEGSEDSELDEDDPAAELIRQTKRQIRETERTKEKLARQNARDDVSTPTRRVDEDMDLGGLSSLSGGRTGGGSGGRNKESIECYNCGGKGHMKSECPKKVMRGGTGRGKGRTRRH